MMPAAAVRARPPGLARRHLLLLLALSACASPDPAFYTLAPVPGTPDPAAGGSVKLRRIGLAGYLDRPEIMRVGDSYRLDPVPGERWGEPLGDLLGRVLAEDLSQRLPGRIVLNAAGSLTAEGDTTVEIDVQRFDADRANTVTLVAQVNVAAARRPAVIRTIRLTDRAGGAGTPQIVAAMSGLLGGFADALAGMLRAG